MKAIVVILTRMILILLTLIYIAGCFDESSDSGNSSDGGDIYSDASGYAIVDTGQIVCYLVSEDGSEGNEQHTWSSNYYLVDTEEAMQDVAFAVNDWTGHIKVFDGPRWVRCVRGDTYGINDFVDNGDGTITDNATGLMWMQDDSGYGMNWQAALAYADGYEYAGYTDWRLPNKAGTQLVAANVKALLRRFAPTRPPSVMTFGRLTINANRRDAFIAGHAAQLSTIEFQLFWSLAQKPGCVVTRDEIYRELYNADYKGYDRKIDLYISRIRQKIGDDSTSPRHLKTVRGVGYQFMGD